MWALYSESRMCPCALLVGRENGAADVENGLAVPQKVKHGVTVCPAVPSLGMYQEKRKHMFTQRLVRECF